MSPKIHLDPVQNNQPLNVSSEDFPGQDFIYVIPEAIGSTGRHPSEGVALWGASRDSLMEPNWKQDKQGRWCFTWSKEDVLRYKVQASAADDFLNVHIKLTNLSGVTWPESTAFSCFNFSRAPMFADFDGERTFLLIDNTWTPITQVPRKDSSRPTIQLWYVRGQKQPLGFVENFDATPEEPSAVEGVLAVRSWDGESVIAVSSDKPLFLFNNLEFSCVHCCPAFGALEPGQTGEAFHRAFIGKGLSLEGLGKRLRDLWT
jgi:hypothetical protein